MKYRIGRFSLDVKARTLSDDNGSQNIRPKTLALLLYLAQRPEQIISKQELLDNIWDDVAVDDGVIFQSVREIRTLFSEPKIVQNFPRKGYQFTAEINKAVKHSWWSTKRNIILTSLLLFVAVIVLLVTLNPMATVQQPKHSVLILPIKSHIPYGENDWLNLGGMEQLITQLSSLPRNSSEPERTYIYQATHVLELMERVGLTNNTQPQGAQAVLTNSGASVVVETEIHGNVYDYKLIYRLHSKNGVHQGVILDTSIPTALSKLANIIKKRPETKGDKNEFSQTLLSEAMISYETDWQTSVSFFESYLTLNPDSVVAMIYLSKLYLWQGQIDKATELTTAADALNQGTAQEKAQVKLLRARLAATQGDWEQAFGLFELAQSYHDAHNDWFLKANIEEERGLAFVELCKFEAAVESFSLANTYYQLINSPIGINSSLLHKSFALFKLGNNQLALLTMQTARENINEIGLVFLNTMLDKYDKAILSKSRSECDLAAKAQ